MRKFFSLKVDLDQRVLFERLGSYRIMQSDHGLYDITVVDKILTGAFWLREEIVVLNEVSIYDTGEKITFFKVNRFLFSLQGITKNGLILCIESSSKSIKHFLSFLEEAIQSKIFISQINISLRDFCKYLERSENQRVKFTHSYASNQTFTKHDKISFSIYSDENAISSADRIIKEADLEFERVKIESYQDGILVTLDIKSNCLYHISKSNSKLEKTLISFLIETEIKNLY